ncbi:MAG: UDP-N-acetylglucosamine 1-carboxyvinyltransferase [Patescibacteria group bacterium]|jgi:UDP-N-acetylglucosamine 1-carboxyvinyltransferase
MAYFIIKSGNQLSGSIKIGGAKNSALKILPAAILADSPSQISNVPKIIDIDKMIEILRSIGVEINFSKGVVDIDPKKMNSSHPDENLIKKLRGSIVLVGALLAKYGNAVISQPGGCLIGARPIDDHLDVFRQLGVSVKYSAGRYYLKGKPKAGEVVLGKMSVTATENAILATVLSKGTTRIHVAAAEPEIADLANYLNKMGAKITGAGTHDITIEGVSSLHGVPYDIIPDRIEAGTYLIIAILTNSELTIGPIAPDTLSLVFKKLKDVGAKFKIITREGKSYIQTEKHGKLIAQDIDTRTYPGFPTDLQSFYAVLMTQAEGRSRIFETIYEGRFASVEELQLLRGKTLILNPHEFVVDGPNKLVGARISSKDIRGGASLVAAALAAEGKTVIEDIEYIDRGYEMIDQKLRTVGADIERISVIEEDND